MLNRLVEHYYWLGRYMERVENLVRLYRTFYHMQTLPRMKGAMARKALAHLIYDKPVADAPCLHTPNGLHEYLFQHANSNSLLSAVQNVRTNLFAVRNRVPGELWEIVNGLYLDIAESDVLDVVNTTPDTFLRNVLHRILAANGLLTNYMMQDAEWNMLESGRAMERIEHTVRLQRVLLLSGERQDVGDEWKWQGMLEAVGGMESYRSISMTRIRPESAGAFVFLHERFPRSVYRSVSKLESHMRKLLSEEGETVYSPSNGLRVVEHIKASLMLVDFSAMSSIETVEWLEQFWAACLRINQVVNREWIPTEGVGA